MVRAGLVTKSRLAPRSNQMCIRDRIFLCVVNALADCIRNLAGLANAKADCSLAVANDYERGELKDTAAFYGFGNTVDGDYVLFELSLIHIYR